MWGCLTAGRRAQSGSLTPSHRGGAEGGCVPPIPGAARGTFLSPVGSVSCHAARSHCQSRAGVPGAAPVGPGGSGTCFCQPRLQVGSQDTRGTPKAFQSLPVPGRRRKPNLLRPRPPPAVRSLRTAEAVLLWEAARSAAGHSPAAFENQVPTAPGGELRGWGRGDEGRRPCGFTRRPCGPGAENPTPGPRPGGSRLMAKAGLGQTEGGVTGTDTRLREGGTQGQPTLCHRPASECSGLCRPKGPCPSTLPLGGGLPQARGQQRGGAPRPRGWWIWPTARQGQAGQGPAWSGGRAGTNASSRQRRHVQTRG